MDNTYRIIEFDKWCKTCKYKGLKEYKDPCNECLDNPANVESEKPIKYKEAKKKVKR